MQTDDRCEPIQTEGRTTNAKPEDKKCKATIPTEGRWTTQSLSITIASRCHFLVVFHCSWLHRSLFVRLPTSCVLTLFSVTGCFFRDPFLTSTKKRSFGCHRLNSFSFGFEKYAFETDFSRLYPRTNQKADAMK